MENKELIALSKESYRLNGKAERFLCHKCNWEQMTRMAVIQEWGKEFMRLIKEDRKGGV